ncbi:FUSC family protein [Streptomyces sp. Ru71]|uniref:FUSC family protein n=1 Tax=Streptomyces sp. Ru71 TaxID=2080746 RepID=UPI000CDD44D1|nr:FUSC family protein [Streptomyces sp. Ru71]POX57222.1 FUSC family protein [Streptomyces sp. Ru71]
MTAAERRLRRRWQRRPVGAVSRVLSPHGALALHRVDGALLFAARAALATASVALPAVLAGRPDLAVYAMLGSFTTTFGRNLPYPRRARVLAVVAVAMTACVGCGSALAAAARPWEYGAGAAVVVTATAVVAGLAKYACDVTRLGGLGAVLLLFSFAVAASGRPAPSDVLAQTAMAAAGAAVAWALALLGRFAHPDRPQRLAVASALRELADLLDATGDDGTRPSRYRATAAVLRAYHCLGLAPPAGTPRGDREMTCVRLADLSWSLLVGSARGPADGEPALPGRLRRQAGLLADRRRGDPPLLPELTPPVTTTAGAASPWSDERAWELLRGGPHPRVPVVPALRIALGTGVAGGLALLFGLGHGYWAAISAAAVLHSVNVRTTAQRAVQRTLGTGVGLLIALGVLATQPAPTALTLVIVALEFLLEYVVVRNYGLGVVFLTPLALLLSDLATPSAAGVLVLDRGLASILGIVVGLACALLVVHDRAALRVERALEACTEALQLAERALADRSAPPHPVVQVRLAVAVVELREADDAAAGELWPAGIDPATPATTEQRAYALLERLQHAR